MIFRYTILYVEHVAETLDFYKRAFGMETAFIHEAGDYGECATGETRLAFSSLALMDQLGKSPRAADAAAPCFELAFETEDVAAALDRAIEAGAALRQPVEEMPWGQVIAYVTDPNGFLIEICSPIQPRDG